MQTSPDLPGQRKQQTPRAKAEELRKSGRFDDVRIPPIVISPSTPS
jgi:hypothetical protein